MLVQLHALLTAFQFLTRIPLPGGMNRPNADPQLLRLSVRYFPWVGACLGLFTAAVVYCCNMLWPISIAILLGLIAEAILTGAFHEDAVADSCDAFGGGWTRDDVLRIMKDSRIGSFGALGLFLAVLLRYQLLVQLPMQQLWIALPLSGCLGRWVIVLLMMLIGPIAERASLTKDIGERLTIREFLLGSCVVPVWLFWIRIELFATTIIVLVGFAIVYQSWLRKRLQGITGDCLGAACYTAQLLVLLTYTARP